jgi:hypothetical protein
MVVDASEKVAWIFLGETGEEFKVDAGAGQEALRVEVERIP